MQELQDCLPPHARSHFTNLWASRIESAKRELDASLAQVGSTLAVQGLTNSSVRIIQEWQLREKTFDAVAFGTAEDVIETCKLYGLALTPEFCDCLLGTLSVLLVAQYKEAQKAHAISIGNIGISLQVGIQGPMSANRLPVMTRIRVLVERARVEDETARAEAAAAKIPPTSNQIKHPGAQLPSDTATPADHPDDSSPTEQPKKPAYNFDRFVGVVSVLGAILFFVLQANGIEMSWVVSAIAYLLITIGFVWTCLSHAIPHIGRKVRYTIALLVIAFFSYLGVLGTSKQYKHDHESQIPQQQKEEKQVEATAQGQPSSSAESPSTGVHSSTTQQSSEKSVSSSLMDRPYDLTPPRRDLFLRLLTPPLRNANRVRVGCIQWSERACVAAGQFLIALSQAGWAIDENRVFRMDEPIPTEGVSIVSAPEPGPPQPPHLGRWHALNLSELTLASAFLAIGVSWNTSSDASLADGTTGVYFSAEPQALKFDKAGLMSMQLSRLQAEIDAIEEKPDTNPAVQSKQEDEWNTEAYKWTYENVNEGAAAHFQERTGEKAKRDYFTGFLGGHLKTGHMWSLQNRP